MTDDWKNADRREAGNEKKEKAGRERANGSSVVSRVREDGASLVLWFSRHTHTRTHTTHTYTEEGGPGEEDGESRAQIPLADAAAAEAKPEFPGQKEKGMAYSVWSAMDDAVRDTEKKSYR